MANSDLSLLLAASAPRTCAEPLEFTAVFRQHFDFVWRALRSFGVPDSVLDDAVQEVFISVHRRLPEFEGRSSLKTWIYSVAYRTAQNHRRAVRRRETSPLDANLVSGEPGPGERLASAQAGRFVLGFLDQLRAERRDVFVLCVLEEMTAPDAAEILGVGLNTVYSRLRLSRAAFRAALERFAPGEEAT